MYVYVHVYSSHLSSPCPNRVVEKYYTGAAHTHTHSYFYYSVCSHAHIINSDALIICSVFVNIHSPMTIIISHMPLLHHFFSHPHIFSFHIHVINRPCKTQPIEDCTTQISHQYIKLLCKFKCVNACF